MKEIYQTGQIILEEWRLDLNIARQMADLFVHDPQLSQIYKSRAGYLQGLLTHGIIFQRTLNEADMMQYYETLGDPEIK